MEENNIMSENSCGGCVKAYLESASRAIRELPIEQGRKVAGTYTYEGITGAKMHNEVEIELMARSKLLRYFGEKGYLVGIYYKGECFGERRSPDVIGILDLDGIDGYLGSKDIPLTLELGLLTRNGKLIGEGISKVNDKVIYITYSDFSAKYEQGYHRDIIEPNNKKKSLEDIKIIGPDYTGYKPERQESIDKAFGNFKKNLGSVGIYKTAGPRYAIAIIEGKMDAYLTTREPLSKVIITSDILRNAGGQVLQLFGEPGDYEAKEVSLTGTSLDDLKSNKPGQRGTFLATATPELAEAILEVLNRK